MKKQEDEFLQEDLDDEKTIEFIKSYLPQDLKDRFTDDQLYYFLDLIYEYYEKSGVLDAEPDGEGFVDIDLDKIVAFIITEAKKDGIGEFGHDEILFVVGIRICRNPRGMRRRSPERPSLFFIRIVLRCQW